jgi:hypothetical protein
MQYKVHIISDRAAGAVSMEAWSPTRVHGKKQVVQGV